MLPALDGALAITGGAVRAALHPNAGWAAQAWLSRVRPATAQPLPVSVFAAAARAGKATQAWMLTRLLRRRGAFPSRKSARIVALRAMSARRREGARVTVAHCPPDARSHGSDDVDSFSFKSVVFKMLLAQGRAHN